VRAGETLPLVDAEDGESAEVENQKLSLTRRVICRFPPVPPPPGPKKKMPDVPVDFRKYGEAMLPTGFPRLVRFKALFALIENDSEYGL
jgi:hypothetical protein